jgi:PKHD-type hydroxylase
MSDYSWFLNTVSLNEYSWHVDGFTSEELDSIVSLGNQSGLGDGLVYTKDGSEKKTDIRDSKISFLPAEKNNWIFQRLAGLVNNANEKYFKFDLHQIQSLQFSIYDKKGFYIKHVDTLPNSPYYDVRKLSFSLLLSDPEEYKGGDLLLHNSAKPIVAERKRGIICFFPSYTLHEVTPVTKGIRKSLVGWVSGPPFR